MKIFEIKNSFIPGIFGADAITLWPFIFFSEKEPDREIVFHEWVHMLQIKIHGVFGFYLKYVWDYIKLRFSGKGHWESYYEIQFESDTFTLQDYFFKYDYLSQESILFRIKEAYYSKDMKLSQALLKMRYAT